MRLKHGHLSNIAVEAVAAAAEVPERPRIHLSLERNPAPAAEETGREGLQRILRAHDAREALPGDALDRLLDALRVFVAEGAVEVQLREFAVLAGLAPDDVSDVTACRESMARSALGGTTTLEAARNLHWRSLDVQANMARLGTTLRETIAIVLRLRRAAAERAAAQMQTTPADPSGDLEAAQREVSAFA